MGHIKLWDKLLDCPKTHRLSDRAFRVWIKALLTALRNGGRNGELPSREMLEFLLRMSWTEIEPTIDELHRCGLLDPCPDNEIGGIPWRIHDWDEWQRPKDPKAAERQARWRTNQALRNASRNGVSHARNNGQEGKKEEEKNKTPIVPNDPPGKARAKPAFILPDWVPIREWEGFLAMRKQIKKPMTELAIEQAVRKLDALRRAGDDPAAVLSQSIFHCWQKLLPLSAGSDAPFADRQPTRSKEEPIKYHVAPPDSPFRTIERERREKLRAIFGGQDGPAPAAEPGGGDVRPGIVPAG